MQAAILDALENSAFVNTHLVTHYQHSAFINIRCVKKALIVDKVLQGIDKCDQLTPAIRMWDTCLKAWVSFL